MAEKTVEADVGVTIDITEVMERLPHRYPFLLVDRAEHYKPGQSITGYKNVTINEPFFVGHFPDFPVMPGVLIVEALAQTGALLMSKTLDVDLSKINIFFMSVEHARFRQPVRPGDVLRMEVEVTRARAGVYKYRGKAMVGDKLAAEAEFAAMSVEKA
jgi:3-hydroxyacyl-[acyl-carrier-protein] dehydratase